MYYDVFNGDADGICALQQLRLAAPQQSELVTGIKREINLLDRVQAQPGDVVTVLDVSLDKNRQSLDRLLNNGVIIHYTDHHYAGEIPEHPHLTANINTEATVCTALLVNGQLKGRYLAWAVTAAFGDNLHESALMAAKPLGMAEAEIEKLKRLGIVLNYNGYGASTDDLFYHPADLYRALSPYENPLDFISDNQAYKMLMQGYQDDMAKAEAVTPADARDNGAVFILPNHKWSRRVSGVYSNDLAQNHPDRAHAVLTQKDDGSYLVSVRAPLKTKTGADELCRQFETGGGRQAAAGINNLPASDLDRFINDFLSHF